MSKHFALTTVLVGVSAVLIAQSQPPPPSPSENAEKKQNVSGIENAQAKPTNSPSQSASPTPNQATPTPTQADTNKKSGVSDKPSTVNWALILTAANTVLLLLFNGILAVVAIFQYKLTTKQADLTEKGLAEAKRAADAAKTSGDASTKAVGNAEYALRVTERAVLRIDDITPKDALLQPQTIITFGFKNFGRTVAYSVKLTGTISVPNGGNTFENNPEMIIPSQGTGYWGTRSIAYWISEKDIHEINQGVAPLTYDIQVTYRDVFGVQHCYNASGRWNAAVTRFEIASDTSD